MPPSTERRALQIAVAICALIPIGAGLAGVLAGPAFTGAGATDISADSHFRYLSGLLLGVGLAFWSTIPAIERHGGRFRLLTLIVFIGGLARLLALAEAGIPSVPTLGGLIMELIATPILCLWQARVANAFHGN